MSNSFLPEKYAEYLGLGAEIAASIAVPLLAGYFADVYFDIFPVLTLVGIGVAVILFIMTIVRMSKKFSSKNGR